VTAWPRDAHERAAFCEAFWTIADRVHVIELGWLHSLQTTTLYRYRLDALSFRPWPDASGQWISESVVEPIAVDGVGDLLARHAEAAIELRVVPSLWPVHDLAVSDRWDYSIVRMSNAQPSA
jgi:hypothetical protein